MHVRFLGFSPPRNPLVRVLLAITGAALLGLFVVFGLVMGAAVMAVLGLVALWRLLAPAGVAAGTWPGAARAAAAGRDRGRVPGRSSRLRGDLGAACGAPGVG